MMDNIKKARARMMITQPFFASLMASTPWIETTDVPTAGTDMKKIYFNPDFFANMPVDEVMGVIAHEVMHIALEHGMRQQSRNHVLWNMACDFAINPILKECGMVLPARHLDDPQFHKMSAGEIYDKLQQMADKARKSGKTGDPTDGAAKSGMPECDPNLQGDLQTPDDGNGDPAEQAKMRQQIQQKVAQAANIARMAGKVPGGLEGLINDILDPKVPWPDVLRDYMLAQVKDDESWSRRNRRFNNIYLPARYSECMDKVVVIGDSSGSMFCQDDLDKMAAEINGVFEMTQPRELRLIWADTRVASDEVFEAGDIVLVAPKGGGGTDMRVPLKYVEQYDPDFVILITDGYTPWPDSVPYPLIVVCTQDATPPDGLGQVVKV